MKFLIVLFAVCGFIVAFVPIEKREADEEPISPAGLVICEPKTPCAWANYEKETRRILTELSSTYCECNSTTACKATQDDTSASVYVYHCKDPSYDDSDLLYS